MKLDKMKKYIIFFVLIYITSVKSENLIDSNLIKKLIPYAKNKGIHKTKLDSNLFYDEIIIKKKLTKATIKNSKSKTNLALIRIKLNDSSNLWFIATKEINKKENYIINYYNQFSIYPIAGDSLVFIYEYKKILKKIYKNKFNNNRLLSDIKSDNKKKKLIKLLKSDFDRIKSKTYAVINTIVTY